MGSRRGVGGMAGSYLQFQDHVMGIHSLTSERSARDQYCTKHEKIDEFKPPQSRLIYNVRESAVVQGRPIESLYFASSPGYQGTSIGFDSRKPCFFRQGSHPALPP